MYAGVDKYGGAVVGDGQTSDNNNGITTGMTLEETIETASAEETVVVNVPYSYYEDEADPSTIVTGTSQVLLAAQLNPESGGLMWVEQENVQETYKNVVAMSQMTSMLRDLDRNKCYEIGIKSAIQKFIKTHNRAPIVLDIGTGTGLLSMFAATHGAAHVYACEMFKPMAEIAKQVTTTNHPDNITVFSLRSTDLIVSPIDGHLPARADMLVSELFDSILLGEAVLPTIRHAMKHLLVPNPVIVPQRATVFAHIVENEHIYRFNSFNGQTIGTSGLRLARNDAALKCTGSSPALPLHIRALESETLKLTSTVPVLSFDFSKPLSCHGYVRTEKVNVRAERSGRAEAVVMWWEVHFDVEDESVIYSTEPGVQNWQDHWVQVVFPLSQREEVTKDHILELYAHHDDLRIWFDVKTSNCVFVRHEKEPCICGLHLVCNAERIYMLTDESRNTAYNDAIAEVVASLKEQSTYKDRISCLDISDGSLCALIVSSHGINSVTSIESKDVSARIFDQVSAGNGLDESIEVLCCGVKGLLPEHLKGERKVDLLVGEPFFYSMQNLPLWQAFNFWYRRSAVDHLLNPNAQIVPYRGHVCAMAVDFEHLHECFGSVGQVSGYDHAFFDSFQHEYFSRNFPFPVYMYPFARVSEVFDLAKLEFTLQAQSIMNSIKIPLDGTTRTPNAVIVWTKYDLDVNGKYVVSTGPTAPHSKQLVRFLQAPQHTSSEQLILHGHFHFDAMEGTINLNFSLE